ncbi:aspartate aminotransferase 2 [Euphorbia peplus]|nr:aspartate aminotransferase 2 [Euphorbia peplus]
MKSVSPLIKVDANACQLFYPFETGKTLRREDNTIHSLHKPHLKAFYYFILLATPLNFDLVFPNIARASEDPDVGVMVTYNQGTSSNMLNLKVIADQVEEGEPLIAEILYPRISAMLMDI